MLSTTSKSKPKHSWQFEAIGTLWSIETVHLIDESDQRIITERINEFDQTYSRFRDDSLVGKIAVASGEYDFPLDAEKIVEFYQQLYEATDGAMSPLVGNMLAEAGYDKEYSLTPGTIHDVPSWKEAMEWDGTHVNVKLPVALDFGAAGKGYLVDIIAELLKQKGHKEYVIDASGDIRTRGIEQTVGLENPNDPTRVIGALPLKNASLCASATNRRAWGEWHHVVDPRTKKPVSEILATWVVAPTTLEADGIATALFFVDAEKLAQWEFQYVRLFANGNIEYSADFVGELFL